MKEIEIAIVKAILETEEDLKPKKLTDLLTDWKKHPMFAEENWGNHPEFRIKGASSVDDWPRVRGPDCRVDFMIYKRCFSQTCTCRKNELDELVKNYHLSRMASGQLLERYVGEELSKAGNIHLPPGVILGVDFVVFARPKSCRRKNGAWCRDKSCKKVRYKKNSYHYELYQIKNKSSTENSSSEAARNHKNAKLLVKDWKNLNSELGLRLTQEGFNKFAKKTVDGFLKSLSN